jgi:carboxyl-terminal processing protease
MRNFLNYLLNMKRLPIVILMVVAGTFLAFQTMGTGTKNPPSKYQEILKLVGEMLSRGHYSPQDINDAFSKKVFKKYINELDPDKNIFLQADIEQLQKKYETKIDDEIKGANVESFLAAGKVFNTRMEEASAIAIEILQKPFDFTVDEDVMLDADKLNYTGNSADLKERWRKKLKYMTLERYADLLDTREKNKGKQGFIAKSDAELEQEAREKTKKIIDRLFERYRFKFSDDDKFTVFVNAITTTMDPHTEFFPPVDKRYFDEEMSGRFFGIGASLQYDDGNIKVSSILTGSPAYKSGELQPGDIIQKVAQGTEEPVDLTGFVVTDAVKLIRGKKGTEVRLTVKKADGAVKVISLVRDQIVQDETFARSAVVKTSNNTKIGYIFLPEFYADFDNPNGNRSFIDVAKEVTKLKDEKVDGIVIDLRNNGGGSLYDVVQMAGLFIEDGPIVQVRDRENKPTVLKDKDKSVLYSGPLAVMVNEFSASASEIFAAAIQDYGRGVIIGSTSTYGKGTVQRNIGLDPDGYSLSNSDLGTVKLTLQKFYRINGGSTQLKGVSSDIVLPDQLEYLKVREKDDPDALPWDEISKSPYTTWNGGYDLKTIQQLSNQRLENDQTFKLIKENTDWLARQNDKRYSLQLEKYQAQQKAIRTTLTQNESLLKLKEDMNVSALPNEENRWANDTNKQERFNQWLKSLRRDIYLDQAVKVVNDIIGQQNLAKGKTGEEQPKKAF